MRTPSKVAKMLAAKARQIAPDMGVMIIVTDGKKDVSYDSNLKPAALEIIFPIVQESLERTTAAKQ